MPRIPDPKDGPQALASFSEELWHDMDVFYAFWVERWRRVMDFLRTQHWRILQDLDLKQIPKWRRFPVSNFTVAMYADFMTQWLQSRVRFSAVPDQPDPSQIAGAELADSALAYLWEKLEIDAKKVDIAAWLLATGNADVRVFWDTDTGDMIPLAIPEMGPDGKPTGKAIPVNPQTLQPDPTMEQPVMVDAGEIGLEVISPQLVRASASLAQGTMIGYLLDYDEACQRYGDDIAKDLSYVKPKGTLGLNLLHATTPLTQGSQIESALIIEHYLPRSSKRPNGLWWTASNRTLLLPPNPLPARRPPLVHFRWIPFPGHPTLGLTPLLDITYSNKTYDEMLARTLEWLGKVVPKALLPAGGGLKQGDLTEEPFQELPVQPGAEPTFPTPPVPPTIFESLRRELADDMMTVGGYKFRRPPQVPQGQTNPQFRQPPQMMNPGEQTALAVINSKAPWEQLAYILLDYVAKFYTDSRVISIVGPDKSYQWKEFKGSDLKNLKATIHVDELSLYTWNRQSMRDAVIGLLGTPGGQLFFAGPDGQPDRERMDNAMSAAGLDRDIGTLDPDVLEARNEISAFQGLQEGDQPPEPQPWQDPEVHIAEKQRVMKSLRFKGWSPAAQKALLQNVSAHEQKIAQAKQAQQDQMVAQEKQLRDIRAQSETAQAVRTKLGEDLIELLTQTLGKEKPTPPKK